MRISLIWMMAVMVSALPAAEKNLEKAVFAGGCFWCMEPPFEKAKGVKEVISGYCGGKEKKPGYEQVASGSTGHAESVLVIYDPKVISYEALLEIFWRSINPTQVNGQFYDRGPQYRTAVFYLNEKQKEAALKSRRKLEQSGKFREKIATEISPATEFWRAEEYHQDYYKKNPEHYHRYRKGSGRDDYLKKIWGSGG